ncbi:MAG: YceI family protein [Pseudomonadota bacterium]
MVLRRSFTIIGLACVLASWTLSARADFQSYRLDPEHTAIGFLVDHLGYADTLGLFTDVGGTFLYDEEAPAVRDVRIVVKAASVFSNSDRRDGHVRGGDFLDAEAHPDIVFVGTEATPTGETTGTITGDLTLLGVTQPVTFDLELNKAGLYPFDPTGAGNPPHVVGVSASATIQRSAFGMTYGVEPGWVGDDVALIIEFEALRVDD